MKDNVFMKTAVEKAKQGIKKGQTPFAACIVMGEKIIACAHNTVWKDQDVTAHAEMQALRLACKSLRTIDLAGAVLFSTCEPCPMCFTACHWARISRIVCGASIYDAKQYGFNELLISNRRLKTQGKSRVRFKKGVLKEECLGLFKIWRMQPNRRVY